MITWLFDSKVWDISPFNHIIRDFSTPTPTIYLHRIVSLPSSNSSFFFNILNYMLFQWAFTLPKEVLATTCHFSHEYEFVHSHEIKEYCNRFMSPLEYCPERYKREDNSWNELECCKWAEKWQSGNSFEFQFKYRMLNRATTSWRTIEI